MDFLQPEVRELDDDEKVLVAKVVAQWRRHGNLTFRRLPNFGASLTLLSFGGLALAGAFAVYFATPWHSLVTSSETVSVTWPFDPPEKVELGGHNVNGLLIEVDLLPSVANDRRSIRFRTKVVNSQELSAHITTLPATISANTVGRYSTQTRLVYRISPSLEVLAHQRDVKARAAAAELLRVIKSLEDASGVADVRRLTPEDLQWLVSRGFLVSETEMVAPKPFQLPVDISVTNGPLHKGKVSAVVCLVALGLFGVLVGLGDMLKLRGGNQITLTFAEFSETRRCLGRPKHITVPWKQVTATEKTTTGNGIGGLLSWLLGADHELVIENEKTKQRYTYPPRTVRRYTELRAAIIARVGLRESHEEWRQS